MSGIFFKPTNMIANYRSNINRVVKAKAPESDRPWFISWLSHVAAVDMSMFSLLMIVMYMGCQLFMAFVHFEILVYLFFV